MKQTKLAIKNMKKIKKEHSHTSVTVIYVDGKTELIVPNDELGDWIDAIKKRDTEDGYKIKKIILDCH